MKSGNEKTSRCVVGDILLSTSCIRLPPVCVEGMRNLREYRPTPPIPENGKKIEAKWCNLGNLKSNLATLFLHICPILKIHSHFNTEIVCFSSIQCTPTITSPSVQTTIQPYNEQVAGHTKMRKFFSCFCNTLSVLLNLTVDPHLKICFPWVHIIS